MCSDDMSYGSLSSQLRTERTRPPPVIVVHGALVVVFVFFGGGSFVSKFGIRGASPLLFELVREAVAGPIFLAISKVAFGRCLPDAVDLPKVFFVCFCFALSQACFFMGLKHENPTVGSTWQAALPIFTTLFAVAWKREEASWKKMVGVLAASGGAMWMTVSSLLKQNEVGPELGVSRDWIERVDGHLLFCGQCVLNALYIVISKPIVNKYGGVRLTGWMFMCGSIYMLVFLLLVKSSEGLSTFTCYDVDPLVLESCIASIFHLPGSMLWPLAYEIICCSLIAWFLLTWCLNYTLPSVVSVYTVIQPVVTCLLSLTVLTVKGSEWSIKYGITVPGYHNLLGGVLIAAGLLVMFTDSSVMQTHNGEATQLTASASTSAARSKEP